MFISIKMQSCPDRHCKNIISTNIRLVYIHFTAQHNNKKNDTAYKNVW